MDDNRLTESVQLEATPSVPVLKLKCDNKNENDGCGGYTCKQNAPDNNIDPILDSANDTADEAVPLISIIDGNDKSELDPHDILIVYEDSVKERGFCNYMWETLFVSWLIILEEDETPKSRAEAIQFKKDLGFTPTLCHVVDRMDDESCGQGASSTSEPLRSNLSKSLCNFLVFILNLYTLFVHTLITEPRPIDDKCQIKFVFNPIRTVGMEVTLLFNYLVIPFLIARAIKFVFENTSFDVLRQWSKMMLKRNEMTDTNSEDENMYLRLKEDIKNKQIRSYWFVLLCFIFIMSVEVFALFFNCRSAYIPYDVVFFILVSIFFASSIFALIVPYNILRMYTSFIQTRTAMFQHDVKKCLAEFDESMEDAKMRAHESEEKLEYDELVVAIKKSDVKIKEAKLVSQRRLDKLIKKGLQGEARQMFEHMIRVNDKLEGPVKVILRLLLLIGAVTLIYIFFYTLFIYDKIWPELQAYMSTAPPTVSPSPSISVQPSSQPSMIPSFQPSESSFPGAEIWPSDDEAILQDESHKPKSSWKYFLDILTAIVLLDPVAKHGLLFFSLVVLILLFNICYMWEMLMLFARQVDAWDQLNKFFEARMLSVDDINSYGSEFNKLGRFVKSSTGAFEWIFIVKHQYDTAVATVTNRLKKQLLISLGTIAAAILLKHTGGSNSVTTRRLLFDASYNVSSASLERNLLRGALHDFSDEITK